MIFDYSYGCCAFAHDIRGSKPMIPTEMPDTSTPLPPNFFVNPRCPRCSSPVLPAAKPFETTGEDLQAKDLPVVEGGVDIPSGPLARPDKAIEG